ncbi:type IV toxin-antitoxin system AbiEi family antitoxin domain-containing protein [Rhodococcus sp. BP-252]|uniref:type IV toxin-antitoxin system AbiEi family antitoxin domain-containing protein n=1 Tax=unclassified Rhodococcus (in: high G+C Gram-positive bacteria) TaxID=192944 RepID=UPI0014307956|nr:MULTISPECIES: type IV toxin-antitoxin system AbiEi family antitoxin domain-containing protein [unclassified Rhodococcus (in: high G+C Gram-positive bacteria)]MBY6410825.1 type IV toxin-antitoxin system AbiEi family antitoxin domain-containing protein [Rhodococcus sp. BP-320]MBY6415350.1 type IV toxin-antitoxin system AbiEi family antitoxin domain-containing protein [Rhodococcus sp. BP-321]MBY6419965.1 type IV toxin-antitoxin system AbiEi family antitoxin domain-containing protein [Rhodococcus
MVTKPSGRWQELLDAQNGILTTTQLYEQGVNRESIRHAVESGQWLRVFRGVISTTNGPLTRSMMCSAALLYAGPRALLSHDTAAEEWGMLRPRYGPVHVTVPFGTSATSQGAVLRHAKLRFTAQSNNEIHPGVVIHRSRAWSHIGVETDPWRTSKPDTVLDLAVDSASARDAMVRMVSAMSSGAVSVDAMRKKVELRRPRRYRKALLDTLALLADGVHSALEHRYVIDVEQAHGLPSSARQAPHHVDGRTLFEDVLYEEVGLIVRLDGQAFHSAKQRRFRDRRRDNAAELGGLPRLVYGWDEVTKDPCGVYSEVRAVLVREGWDDTSFPCERCAHVHENT